MADLHEVQRKVSDNALYGVYQDWVHQNPGNNLDGRINDDGKWKARCKKLVCFLTQRYNAPSGRVGKKFYINHRSGP